MHWPLRVISGIAAVLLWANTAVAKDIDERKWILMESGNFSIYSSLKEKKTRDLLLHLEALRSVFASGLLTTSKLEEKRTRILVVGNSSDYRKLGMPDNSAGVFFSGLRDNFIVISNSSSMSESQVILHEYVHFIVRATDPFPYPKWWDEGHAEFASASNLSKKRFEFGLPLRGRLETLAYMAWIPWEDVLTATSLAEFNEFQQAAFYAQSWLLVHYLHNRGDASPSIRESWSRYLQKLHDGADALTAFESGFGLSIQDVKKEVKQYRRRGIYKYWRLPFEDLNIEFDPSSRKVTRHDIQVQLGQLALRRHDADAAKMRFRSATDIQPQSAVAVAGLASALALDGHYDDAKIQFDIALSMEPNSPDVLVDYAKITLDRASSTDAWFTRRDHLEDAERLLTNARSIAGGSVEIDTYLAYTWLQKDPESFPALKLLENVIQRSPSDQWPRLLYAECVNQAGYPDLAVDLAQAVIRYDHGANNYSVAARKLIEQIRRKDEKANGPRPQIAAPQLPQN